MGAHFAWPTFLLNVVLCWAEQLCDCLAAISSSSNTSETFTWRTADEAQFYKSGE